MHVLTRILLIEDDDDDALLTSAQLRKLPPPAPEIVRVATLAEALERLHGGRFQLVLSDLNLPDSDPENTCRSLCATGLDIPVVVLTGSRDETFGLEAIQLGAQDYLVKGDFHVNELRRVLHHALERQRMRAALLAEKRATEEALAKLQQLESMREQLVHMVVHDLRSPLFGMRLYLEGFLRDSQANKTIPDDLRDDVAKTYDLSGSLIEMVSSILDVHRMESGQMPLAVAAAKLGGIIAEAVELIAGQSRRSTISLAVPDITIRCDAALVRRAVGNLIGNALRFSPVGRPIAVGAVASGDAVEITVTDQGPGVPQDAQTRIFRKFGSLSASAKAYSTGLGLPFCKIVAELHGGGIGVRSQSGGGSVFWMRLPLVAAPPFTR
jgi:two-component system sensor histidine kinase/response regulator